MPRLRLIDCKKSRLPSVIGLCEDDTPRIAQYVNAAQRRLLLCREAGDEGWWGTFAEVAFSVVSRTTPYITCTRDIARIEKIDVCSRPVPMHNQFMEYLAFGNGRMPQLHNRGRCLTEGFARDNAVTFSDLVNGPKIVRVYASESADIDAGRRVFVGGLDNNNTPIYTQDGFNLVQGAYVTLASPFVDLPMQFNYINSIQKSTTVGEVQLFQVDPVTGAQSLMLTMQPGEQVAGYRRYYLNDLPCNCCNPASGPVLPLQVTAIAKLEMIPVGTDSDYCLLQNLEAITEECQSIRYSEMESESAKKMAAERHVQAVRLLQGELVHYLGKTTAAVNFAPFGSAKLGRQKIGTLI